VLETNLIISDSVTCCLALNSFATLRRKKKKKKFCTFIINLIYSLNQFCVVSNCIRAQKG
jgi:CRISPR/Cas system-associated protein endoribonuclease Cas2